MAQSTLQKFTRTMRQGYWPYVITLAHIILGTVLVYVNPRSNIAFLVLITSFFSLYSLGTSTRFKLITGIILALVIIPVIGVRNIFYLEIIFQISVFAALGTWAKHRGWFCRTA
jgi:branched-chain amino acid transport system permease protein